MDTKTQRKRLMTERGILFRAPMVRALLAGTKTQTRRIVKPQPFRVALVASGNHLFDHRDDLSDYRRVMPMDKAVTLCPHGKPGDRLWVRETWRRAPGMLGTGNTPSSCEFRATYNTYGERDLSKWTQAIHMFRWASRITLEITDVRMERLQDISEADAKAEGVAAVISKKVHGWTPHVLEYSLLWDSINGVGAWKANPWVWVLEFKRLGTLVEAPQQPRQDSDPCPVV